MWLDDHPELAGLYCHHFGGPEFASAIMNFEIFMFGLVYIKWFLRDKDQNGYRKFWHFFLSWTWSLRVHVSIKSLEISWDMSRMQMEQNYIIKIHNTLLYMSEGMHNAREFGCMNGFWLDTWTHSDDYKVCWKKVQKFTISILIPVTQNPFYVYWPKHDFFEIHNGRGNFWPSKTATIHSSRFASSPCPKLLSKSRWAIYCDRTGLHSNTPGIPKSKDHL